MSLVREARSLKRAQRAKNREAREKIDKLESFLEEKEGQISELNEKLNPPEEQVKSVRCSYWGFEKAYKNGTYKRKRLAIPPVFETPLQTYL